MRDKKGNKMRDRRGTFYLSVIIASVFLTICGRIFGSLGIQVKIGFWFLENVPIDLFLSLAGPLILIFFFPITRIFLLRAKVRETQADIRYGKCAPWISISVVVILGVIGYGKITGDANKQRNVMNEDSLARRTYWIEDNKRLTLAMSDEISYLSLLASSITEYSSPITKKTYEILESLYTVQ